MKIYISGKISGLAYVQACRNFDSAVLAVADLNSEKIVNPVRIKPALGIKLWVFYMISCLRAQRSCTHSAFQANWLDSRGAVIEYFFARFIWRHAIIMLKN